MNGRSLVFVVAIVVAGLWGAGLGKLHWDGNLRFLERIEATATDLRTLFRGIKVPPDLVTIIAIDDEVVRQDGSYPISRTKLAHIVDALARFSPKVVAVDLLLVDPGTETGDALLAQSLSRVPSVIAAAAVYQDGTQETTKESGTSLDRIPIAERFLLPLKVFSDIASVGIVNVGTDNAGTPRFFPMLFKTDDRIVASFPLRVAAVAGGVVPNIEPNRVSIGGRSIRTDIGHILPINFFGPRGTIRTVSASKLLDGQLSGKVIDGRVVVVGTTVTGGGDVFPTPFDPVLPGVEVIATAITHLMSGNGLVRDKDTRLADATVSVVLPVVLVALLWWRRSAVGFCAILGVIGIWLGISAVAFSHGIWFSAVLPIAAALPPVLVFGSAQIWLSRRRAQHFAAQSESLQRFHAPALAERLVTDPEFLVKPVQQQVAIVFIDLSGFTGLSEVLGLTAVRELLNAFYARLEEPVVACGGAITNFMGDGAMIVFGLPEPKVDDAFQAVQCCAGLSDVTRDWIASLPQSVSSRIGYKIGAHLGMVVVSRLGGGSHQQITATGDTVNMASRLMEVAAGKGAELALSDDLLQSAGDDTELHRTGILSGPQNARIRGRSGALSVWLWRGQPLRS